MSVSDYRANSCQMRRITKGHWHEKRAPCVVSDQPLSPVAGRRGPPVGRLVLGILLGTGSLPVVLRAGEPEGGCLEMVLWTRGPSLRTTIRNSES